MYKDARSVCHMTSLAFQEKTKVHWHLKDKKLFKYELSCFRAHFFRYIWKGRVQASW